MDHMTIEATIRIWREGPQFVAHAVPIDVASSGDTPESARMALLEAVELFVATARQHGTLTEVLEECGYTHDQGRWVAPRLVTELQDLLAV